jgi:hypothetical protein
MTVMWELSWYRFEVDLSDSSDEVRREDQGAELSELSSLDSRANAKIDGKGHMVLSADSDPVTAG